MQPLSKALRRRLKRLVPDLGEADIDRFEHERRTAMEAALRDEDPLYAEALGPAAASEAESEHLGMAARTGPPRAAATSMRRVRELGSLLQRAAEDEQRRLERKADRVLARQGEAARPKRVLPRRAAGKKTAAHNKVASKSAPRKAAAGKVSVKRSAPKRPARKTGSGKGKRPMRAPGRGR